MYNEIQDVIDFTKEKCSLGIKCDLSEEIESWHNKEIKELEEEHNEEIAEMEKLYNKGLRELENKLEELESLNL